MDNRLATVIRHHEYLTHLINDTDVIDFGFKIKKVEDVVEALGKKIAIIGKKKYPDEFNQSKDLENEIHQRSIVYERILTIDKTIVKLKKSPTGKEQSLLQLQREKAELLAKYPTILDKNVDYQLTDRFIEIKTQYNEKLNNDPDPELHSLVVEQKEKLRESHTLYLEMQKKLLDFNPNTIFFKSAEVSVTQDALCTLVAEAGIKKTELLLVTQDDLGSFNIDLLEVIKMRATYCKKHNMQLIVMAYMTFSIMMDALPDVIFPGIHKLSFLHHFSGEGGYTGKDYRETIATYVSRIPDLKEILIRSCNMATIEEPYHVNIIKFKARKKSPLADHELQLSQGMENGIKITFVRYRDPTLKSNIISYTLDEKAIDMHITKPITHEILMRLQEQLQLIDPNIPELCESKAPKLKPTPQLNIRFFDRTLPMAEELRKKVTHRRAQKRFATHFSPHTFMGDIEKELRGTDCMNDITLTAYAGLWSAACDRVVPAMDHGFDKIPGKSLTVTIPARNKSKTITPT